MKLSRLVVFCALTVFAFAGLAHADDFGDEPAKHGADPATPPSAAGDYNKELTDAAGPDHPKTPEPTANKPAPTSAPTKDASATHSKAKRTPAKAKKAKKTKKSKKKHKKSPDQ